MKTDLVYVNLANKYKYFKTSFEHFRKLSFSALFRDVSKSTAKSLTGCVQEISIHIHTPQKHKHFLIVTRGKTRIEIKIAVRPVTA